MADEIKEVEEKAIPYDRFRKVVEEKNTLTSRISELEGQLQALSEKAATVDTLAGRVRSLESDLQSANSRYETFSAISGAGITDPEIVAAVEWSYGRLPAENRPALGDWLTGIKADPSKAPAVLRPHLGTGQAPTGQAPTGQAGQVPPANAGARPNLGPPPSPTSAEAIGRMTPAEYKASREAILSGIRR